MFLKSRKNDIALQVVYQLAVELAGDPAQVKAVQTLTKDQSRPFMGLRGKYGLFGSDEWWRNIQNGVLPTRHISGTIKRLFHSGQEQESEINTFELLLGEGLLHIESIYTNDKANRNLFKVGSRVEILYVLDELKMQPAANSEINYSEIVLEMAIQVQNLRR